MNVNERVSSVLNSSNLERSITGIQSFHLSELKLIQYSNYQIPSNLRLGHMAEKIVSQFIKSSSNYKVLHENVQIIEDKKTLGEIDFILQDLSKQNIIHLELAYKFYLYDPSISSIDMENWIGPNRKDSLHEKLNKLKTKQFPLLHHPSAKEVFQAIKTDQVSKALCFLANLYVPYEFKTKLDIAYQKAVRGYYISFDSFLKSDTPSKKYYFPNKLEWGISPDGNQDWKNLKELEHSLTQKINEKQSMLCWQKDKELCSQYFVVWWEC